MCDREETNNVPAEACSPSDGGSSRQSGVQAVSRRHLSECGSDTKSSPPDQSHSKALRKTKSVSFHNTTGNRVERKPKSVQECLQYMLSGDTLVKIRNNLREFPRFFSLTEDLDAIRWVPSKKPHKAKVMVSAIKEIRVGCSTAVFRNCDFNDRLTEQCAFSIIYGEQYESLDLLARSPEEANIWVTGLQALIAPEGIESGRGDVREKWLAEMFASAAGADSPDRLEASEAVELVRRLADSDVIAGDIQQRLTQKEYSQAGDDCRAKLTSRQFIDLFKEVATRPDVDFLLFRHSNKEYMNVDDVHMFLESEQGMKGINEDRCMDLIRKYEPNPESRQNGQLMVDGLMRYLLSSECDVFSSVETTVCQDMDQPLTHYFISCSHNTYLMQDQLRGCSSVEGYQRALCTGCRCVKVDCWDGSDGQPEVYHGNTLTTRIQFSEVVRTIKQFAFTASDYPLFLHLENHCSIPVQHRIADILQEYLSDVLYQHPADSTSRVVDLSPQHLKRRIIILGKKLSGSSLDETGQVSDEEDERTPLSVVPNSDGSSEQHGQMALCRRLSDLINIKKFSVTSTLTSLLELEKDVEMVSMGESLSSRFCQTSPEQLINLSRSCLILVFPSSSRVDSSNFNPLDFWNTGLQMVALNHQTPGTMMDLYDGQFRRNGCCGFVLKPPALRDVIGFYSPISREPLPGITPKLLRIKVISGQQLAKPRGSSAKGSVVDPYVVVQVFGAPVDCTEVRGKTVSDGGNCPLFDETFELFISVPQLCMVRFLVLDDEFIGDDFIGQFTASLECLQAGYRHISLLSNTGEVLDRSTLFVHIFTSTRLSSTELKRKTKSDRATSEVKLTGIREMDDFFKTSLSPLLVQTQKTCSECALLLRRLQCECGVASTAGLRQCSRAILQRIVTCDVTARCHITEQDGVPTLHLLPASPSSSSTSSLPSTGAPASPPTPPVVQRALLLLQSACLECRRLADRCQELSSQLRHHLCHVSHTAARLEQLCDAGGLRGRKRERARDAFTWNARLLQAQIDLLEESRNYALQQLEQMRSSGEMVDQFNRKRTSTVRDRPRIALSPLLTRTSSQPPLSQTCDPCSPSRGEQLRPKSILKKCHSSSECVSLARKLTLTPPVGDTDNPLAVSESTSTAL